MTPLLSGATGIGPARDPLDCRIGTGTRPGHTGVPERAPSPTGNHQQRQQHTAFEGSYNTLFQVWNRKKNNDRLPESTKSNDYTARGDSHSPISQPS